MKRAFLMLLSFLTAIFPALSESNDSRTITKTQNGYSSSDNTINEYAPLIREDRVWEYINVNNTVSGDIDDRKEGISDKRYRLVDREIRVKFDGTEEIDGKTYHILNAIYTRKSLTANQTTPLEKGIEEIAPLAYMREENGKVWMRRHPNTDDYNIYLGGFFNTGCHLGSNGIAGSTEEDYLIYDFTADTGDIVDPLVLFEDKDAEFHAEKRYAMGLYGHPDYPDYDIWEIYDDCQNSVCKRSSMPRWEYCVSDISEIGIDNESKSIDSPEYHGTLKQQKTCWFDAVEGVGCLQGGILCFPGKGCWSVWDAPIPIYLNKVYNLDGKVLFENPLQGYLLVDTATLDEHHRIVYVGVDEVDAEQAEAEYFSMDGRKVAGSPAPGIYIERKGNSVRKVIIK